MNLAVFVTRLYQKTFSPDHGPLGVYFGTNRCKFFPSCSEYTLRALRQYGLFFALVVSLKRIFRCHPFSSGGYDPIP